MQVALTAWENRISPVFDAAKTLLIAEIRDGKIVSMRHEPMDPVWISHLADRLCGLGVDVLICGAISRVPSTIIEASGIQLIPFIGGAIDDVLAAYARNGRIAAEFFMPGCGRGQRRKGRGACGSPCACMKEDKEVCVMPRGDRTGPQGLGPGTGRGRGPCQGGRGNAGTGAGNDRGQGSGRGQGRGQGQGRGAGQGRGNK